MRIWLYDEGSSDVLDLNAIAGRLRREMPWAEVDVRGPFTSHHAREALGDPAALDRLAHRLAKARLAHPKLRTANARPLWREIVGERRLLENPALGTDGATYIGYDFQAALRGLLPREEARRDCLHVVYTSRFQCYWYEPDECYYGSTVICSSPAVISLAGLLEGPGNSKAYYKELEAIGDAPRSDPRVLELHERFEGQMLDYDDPRTSDAATAMTWQAIFYVGFGVEFCEDTSCRLFNSHWQDALLPAVLPEGGRLCETHARVLAAHAPAGSAS